MLYSILLSLLHGISLALASRIPKSTSFHYPNIIESEDARFNRRIREIMLTLGYDLRESNFQRFLQLGNHSELYQFFAENVNFLIPNMNFIRLTINNDAFYMALLADLLKINFELRSFDAIVVEFCAIYKARPDTIDMANFLRQIPSIIVVRIGFVSLSLEHWSFVGDLIRAGKFNLNSPFCIQEGFKGNAVIAIRTFEGVRFALQYGLDFNAPIILADGKEVSSLRYFSLRSNKYKDIIDLLLSAFPFSNEVFSQAVHEFASLGYMFAYTPMKNGQTSLKLFKVRISNI